MAEYYDKMSDLETFSSFSTEEGTAFLNFIDRRSIISTAIISNKCTILY